MTLGPLAPLAAYRQFIVVLLVPLANGKTNKLPVRYDTGQVCDAHDSTAWTDYDTAAAVAKRCGSTFGVGFVLTDADPFFCLDIDSCAQPDGTWSELSRSLVQQLPGCAIEVSQSGGGLHVWGRRSAMPAHASKDIARHIELYSSKRFILLGSQAVGEMAEDCTAIDAVVAAFFPPREAAVNAVADEGPRDDWRGPADDAELLRRAMQSKSASNVFGGKASFADLFHADERALGRAFPPDAGSSEPYDRSSADAALAQHLAFWTGCDAGRIERLMRQSALVRGKWDDRQDYLVERTIRGACRMQRDVLQDRPSAVPEAPALTPVAAAAATMTAVDGNTFLSPTDQAALFKGCVYILDAHRVLVPGGHMLKPDQFRARFGGYSFVMDPGNTKVSRNAWEAFTESQVLRPPRADGTCFRPDLPYGEIVTDAGRTRANMYWPVDVPCKPGDVTPFLNHVEKLFPNVNDRRIALAYMAFIVQYPGYKSQWALLIQGVEGNGKTYLSRVVAEAVGRRYTYWPKAKKIAAQFNSWLYGHIFFAVEDIHTGADTDILDEIKPMITGGDGLEIEAKGVDQTTREICGNFIFNSNHKNAIKKTANDRRFAVLFCAQQEVADLIRDGMDEAYMTGLYDWSKAGGYAAITHYLKTYPIPDDLNPAKLCQRAPLTTSTAEAISQSLGSAEQHVLEAIDEGVSGFRGGWVSSHALDLLLDRIGKARSVSINRRRDLMRSLGYDWHPRLTNGRVTNQVMPDGAKPRLYVTAGHASLKLATAAEVARAYTAAQGVGA
jgi:hypothetical protein